MVGGTVISFHYQQWTLPRVLNDTKTGADPGFLLGRGAPLRNGITD